MLTRFASHSLRLLLLLALPAILAFAHSLFVHPNPQDLAPQVSVESALNMPDTLWIDARARDRYIAGHIPGAILLNQEEWESLLENAVEQWTPERPVIVYCDGRGCEDSRAVAARLRHDLAADNIQTLKGGLAAWRKAGRPLETGGGGQ